MTGVGLTEDPETAREPIGEVVIAGAVGSDCQTDGRGGSRVGGAVNPTPEALAHESGDQRKTGRAAHQIDAGDVCQVGAAVVEPADQRSHRGQRALDERSAGPIQIGHGQDDVLAPQDDEHPATLRGQVLLGVPALIQQVVELGVGQILFRDPGLVQHHRGHEQVDVVTA